ncbi:MAG TPA: aminopeptidase P N-terminal domain-containing protein, partial [Candidatus Ruania gallistercoris]|nr:aminopeptidase P N-terminal domain-containing protein [Candidatus Ruania gallistercoris]
MVSTSPASAESSTPSTHRPGAEQQQLADRGSNRSQRPSSQAFRDFIAADWAPRTAAPVTRDEVADHAERRRAKVSASFPGERLVVPAGGLKVRSNDTDYRFRPHSAFAHLTGLGSDEEPDAVLVLHPEEAGGHEAVLYFRPLAGRDTEEFYADARYGEFWVGARPTLEELEIRTGLRCAHIDELPDALGKDAGLVRLRVVPEADEAISAVVQEIRGEADEEADAALAEALSELRLVKDDWEVEQLRQAVAVTIAG